MMRIQSLLLLALILLGLATRDILAVHLPVQYCLSVETGPDRSNYHSCKLLNPNPQRLNEGFGAYPSAGYVPSTGVLKAQMIFVDFDDAQASEATSDLYEVFLPNAAEWYRNASFGRLDLNVTADLSQFYRMPHNSTTYNYHRMTESEPQFRYYIQDALDVVGMDINFTGTDILYIVPTKEASEISYSPTFMSPAWAADGTVIRKTVTFGQDMYEFGFKVMNHETGHAMGLPDLYSYEPHTRAGIFVGGYDLMAQIEGISPDYLAWHKWRLGWIDDHQVACVAGQGPTRRSFTLSPIEKATTLNALIIRYNATLAIVAEHRAGRGLNSNICGNGVLIYTVSTLVESGHGPIRVQDSSPRSGGCAGEELNDALFVPESQGGGRSTFAWWGTQVTVVKEIADGFVVEVHSI